MNSLPAVSKKLQDPGAIGFDAISPVRKVAVDGRQLRGCRGGRRKAPLTQRREAIPAGEVKMRTVIHLLNQPA